MPLDHPEKLDRYRILDLLGRGSMGDVYLAVDPKFDRKIALKVMSAHRLGLDDELQDMRRRFVHEALAAGRLNHPDIVTIHDADTDGATGWPFIAMEWVEGESLRARLRRQGPLALEQALTLTARVARALDYAHRQGVVHRDIKPANLLLRRDDLRPKIADFGVAKLVSSSLTLTGQVLGSPNYMSPEQVKAEPVDGRTDLFALGVVLYESLAGRPAFAAESLASITFKIVNVDPRPVGIYNSEAPPALQTLLDRALAKDPEDRFSTGAEMAEALDDLAADYAAEHPAGSRRSRPSTKELTLPAGVPETAVVEAAKRGGGTVDLAGTAARDEALPAEPPRRRFRLLRFVALACLAMVLGFAGLHLWLEPPTRPEMSTLTRRLGIFERQMTGLVDSAIESAGNLRSSPILTGDPTDSKASREEPAGPSDDSASGDSSTGDGSTDSDTPLSLLADARPADDSPALAETLSTEPGTDPERPLEGQPSTRDPEIPTLEVNLFPANWRGHPRAAEIDQADEPESPPASEPGASPGADTSEADTAAADMAEADTSESTPRPIPSNQSTTPETAPLTAAAPTPPVKKKRKLPKVPMTISLEKRFKLAYISIWIDGRKVRTRRLEGGNWMRRLAGQSYEFEIDVPAGEHKIEAHVSGLSTRFEARGKVIADFEPGRPKTLWVEVHRNPDKLQLSWRNP